MSTITSQILPFNGVLGLYSPLNTAGIIKYMCYPKFCRYNLIAANDGQCRWGCWLAQHDWGQDYTPQCKHGKWLATMWMGRVNGQHHKWGQQATMQMRGTCCNTSRRGCQWSTTMQHHTNILMLQTWHGGAFFFFSHSLIPHPPQFREDLFLIIFLIVATCHCCEHLPAGWDVISFIINC